MKYFNLFIIIFIIFLSCVEENRDGVKVEDYKTYSETSDFYLIKLFSINGNDIYRFYDKERYHYFILGTGKPINAIQEYTIGKDTEYSDDFAQSITEGGK